MLYVCDEFESALNKATETLEKAQRQLEETQRKLEEAQRQLRELRADAYRKGWNGGFEIEKRD